MDRPTRVVLWRSIVPPFRNRRRVHRGSLAAGGSNPRSRAAGTRGLSRHPGITAHRAVHVTGPIEGPNRSRPGWGWCGGSLCRSTRPSSGSASDRDLPLGERQGDSIASRSGKEMMSNARRSRSTLQPATWRPPGGISVQTPLWPAAVAVSFKKIAAG